MAEIDFKKDDVFKNRKFAYKDQERFENILNKDPFPITVRVEGATTAGNYGVFFHARMAYEIIYIAESHTVAGSDAGAVTLNIERLSGTEALDSGDEILVTAFDLKGTANTVSEKKGTALQNTKLSPGDRLALKDSGTLTAVAGVCVTLFIKPIGKGDYR